MAPTWRKIVAVLVSVPMMVAMAASASAVETDSQQSAGDSAVTSESSMDDAAGYLWLHFSSTDYEKIYYGYSANGLNWQKLNNNQPILSSSVGTKGLRDPHLLKLQEPDADGNKYVMLATDLHAEGTASGGTWDQINASKYLVVSRSKDLVTWTTPQLVSTGLEGKVGNAWAPEAIWDEQTQDYLVYWSSRDLSTGNSTATTNLKVYKAHTKDFTSFDDPTLWIDESSLGANTEGNIIDTTIVKGNDGDYYRFSTSDWYTVVDTSSTLDAAKWTRLVERDSGVNADGKSKVTGDAVATTTASGLYGTNGNEGLTVYQDSDGQWIVMADHSGYKAYGIDKLSRLKTGGTFSAVSSTFGDTFRHGTVVALSSAEKKTVLASYGQNIVEPVDPDPDGSDPITAYDFEDSSTPGKDTTGNGNDLTLSGSPVIASSDGGTDKTLQLDGNGQYAQFPTGLFDKRNKLTVQMDVKSEKSGNLFTFAFGQNSTKYYFMRYRSTGDLGNHITTASYGAEDTADATLSGSGTWHKVTVVFDDTTMTVYSDGEQVASNTSLKNQITDLGTNLLGYLGKSFYNDPYFKGAYDNITIWNRALTADEVAALSPETSTKLSVAKTSPNNQVLSQTISDGTDGEKNLDVVLDYWTPTGGTDGTKTDKSKLSLDFTGPKGATLTMADGSPVPSVQDLSRSFKVKVTRGDDSQIYNVRAVVLVTPIRASGQKDGTGVEGMKFFADPQVVADGGKYYIFPTTDGYSGWRGWQIRCFESDDLVNWTDKGVVIDLTDQKLDGTNDTSLLPKRTSTAWAPAFAKKDGKYYLYFSGNEGVSGTNQTNVAVSDRIDGGYVIQSNAGANHDGKVADNIDPATFQDPATGTWYLTWGQGPGKYAELSDDMMSIKEGTTVTTNATKNMREGSYITARKWNGKWTYYYSYSIDDTNDATYRVAYATAPSMEGDGTQWTYQGEILTKDESKGILGTGHHSILQVPGTDDWYVVYHCFLTDEMRPRLTDTQTGSQIRTGNKREVRIARMTYSEPTQEQTDAGQVPLIETVPVTYEGVLPETTPAVSVSVTAAKLRSVASATASDARVGDTLTAQFNDGWKVSSIQWYRDDKAITGATTAQYTLAAADGGHSVTAKAVGESTTGVKGNAQPDDASASASTTDTLVTEAISVAERTDPIVTVESIAVTSAPSKTTYTVGEKFSASGLVVKATMSDGSLQTLSSDEYATGSVDTSTAGSKTVRVTLVSDSHISATFTIVVRSGGSSDQGNTGGQTASSDTDSSGKSTSGESGERLSSTGMAIIGVAVAGLFALLVGLAVSGFRKRN